MSDINNLTDQELARRAKIEKLKEMGVEPFGQRFERTTFSSDIQALGQEKLRELGVVSIDTEDKSEEHKAYMQELHEKIDAMDLTVVIAGRIMFIRKMGKASFFSLQDVKGKQQVYISINDVGEEQYNLFKMADIGDIVGVEGKIMLTQTGAITVKCTKYTHLSKSLRPLPEKFHGLTDKEERYRRRYLDLIMSEDSKRIALLRPRIIRSIQNYMDGQGFIEVETPVLQPILGGAAARPFVTHHNTLDMDFYLRIATELPLKRLIVGGLERVYEIGRIFRNEGMDVRHNPEFTTIEAYQAYGDMNSMMDLAENLIRQVALDTLGTTIVHRNGVEIDLSKPFRRIKMVDFVLQETGIDFRKITSFEEAKKLAEERGLTVEKHFTGVGHILNLFFEEYCEEKMIQPTFLIGHPIEISPLAKKNAEDPRYTDRFELFILGVEYANAFSELNDPIDQRERFEKQLEERELGNDEANQVDTDFVEALEYGMPPTGGIGIGVDRLIILLSEVDSIRDVLLFPHMRNK